MKDEYGHWIICDECNMSTRVAKSFGIDSKRDFYNECPKEDEEDINDCWGPI